MGVLSNEVTGAGLGARAPDNRRLKAARAAKLVKNMGRQSTFRTLLGGRSSVKARASAADLILPQHITGAGCGLGPSIDKVQT